jgi:hypothetical protein
MECKTNKGDNSNSRVNLNHIAVIQAIPGQQSVQHKVKK